MTEAESLQWDADRLMEQLIMQESRHMQMGALVSFQLRYPDTTIRDFFTMSSKELEEQEEHIDLSLEENAEWDNPEVMEEDF